MGDELFGFTRGLGAFCDLPGPEERVVGAQVGDLDIDLEASTSRWSGTELFPPRLPQPLGAADRSLIRLCPRVFDDQPLHGHRRGP